MRVYDRIENLMAKRKPKPPPKPPWCGVCDRDTRQAGTPDAPYRCPKCHPLEARSRP